MVDALTVEGDSPQPMTACPRCGSTAFDGGRRSGLSTEIFCQACGAGYWVNVLHDGVYLVDAIGPRPRRRLHHRLGHRRRATDR